MSLSAFKEKILQDATAQAESLVRERAAENRNVYDSAMHEMRTAEENSIAAAHIEAERQARSIHQRAELEGRSMVLAAKQEELLATQKAFVSFVASLDEDKKKDIHTALCKLIPEIHGEVVPQDDGGLIFRSKGVEINLTLPYVIGQLFRTYRAEIAKELFA